jgi:hypothetical protein
LIIAHEVTAASVNDSQKLANIVPEGTDEVYDDAGYVGEDIDLALKAKCPDVEQFTCAKAKKNKPLTKGLSLGNSNLSKTDKSASQHQ